MEDSERSEQKMMNAELLLMGFMKTTLMKNDEEWIVPRAYEVIKFVIEKNAKDAETKEALLDALHYIGFSFGCVL